MEPVYYYKKGVGWSIAPTLFVKIAGKCYRFEARYPKPGERYCNCKQRDTTIWNSDGSNADIQKWTAWAEKHGLGYDDFSVCVDEGEIIRLYSHQYVTAIPL